MPELNLKSFKDAGYEVLVRPADASAGKLDQDEIARISIGGCVLAAALALIFVAIPGTNRDLLIGAGIPMITTAATIATGGKVRKA